MSDPRPVGRLAKGRAPAPRGGVGRERGAGMRRLLGRLTVLLLAVALAASGGMTAPAASMVLKAPAHASCEVPAQDAGMAGHGAHGVHEPQASGCEPGSDHEHGATCSLCLLARVGVQVAGPELPPRPLTARALRWIGPAARWPPEVHARAPPARGPPPPVFET